MIISPVPFPLQWGGFTAMKASNMEMECINVEALNKT